MEPEFSRRRLAVCMTVGVVIALAIFAVAHGRPWESATPRAYRLYVGCGVGAEEIGRLIDTMRHSTVTREQNLELFHATFEDRSQAEPYEPCAEAILTAADL